MSSREIANFGLSWEKDYGYCQARRVDDFIFVAGQLSHDEKGKLVGIGDFEKQARQTYKNMARALRKLGASIDDVVSDVAYITDMETQAPSITKIHKEVFGKKPPTSTVVEVKRLFFKEQLIEVNAIARTPDKKPKR